MSKKFKAQANSSRASSTAPTTGFGTAIISGFSVHSPLSYLNELPDLSRISDPNVVVAFKNLSKKDSTTKAKALEDLQSLLPKSEVEDNIIEAWVSIYPRTSIDTSRRVRQLAHTQHGHIVAAAGKKIAKYMPKAIGAWLAGLYDNDKLVARAAQEAVQQVFPAEEKRQALRKAYQEPLLDFVRNALEQETPQSLSDERTVNPDEALATYSRVVAASIGLLSSLLAELQSEDLQQYASQYDTLFESRILWEFSLHEDPTVRRAIHRLLQAYAQKWTEPSESTLDMLSSIYIYKGLESDQSTSAIDYLDSLIVLSKKYPTVWTDHYHGKKPVNNRLKHFFKKGSQGSAGSYWSNVTALLTNIPRQTLPTDTNEAVELLKSLHAGFTRKEEPRAYLGNAFKSYVRFVDYLASTLSKQDRLVLLETSVLPILRQFVHENDNEQGWKIPDPSSREVISQVLNLERMVQIIAKVLPEFTDALLDDIRSSRPQQSKDYHTNQHKLATHGERYAYLLGTTLKAGEGEAVQDSVFGDISRVASAATEIVKSRDGKPYGATNVLAVIAINCPSAIDKNTHLAETFDEFAPEVSRLILSASSAALLVLLRATTNRPMFRKAQISALEAVMKAPEPVRNIPVFIALAELVSSTQETEFVALEPKVRKFIRSCVDNAFSESDSEDQKREQWRHIAALVSGPSPGDITEVVLSTLVEHLTIRDDADAAYILDSLHRVWKLSPGLLRSSLGAEVSNILLNKILRLTTSQNEHIAKLARELKVALETPMLHTSDGNTNSNSSPEIIAANLNKASEDSLPVNTLINYIKALPQQTIPTQKRHLLPDAMVWKQQLDIFLTLPPSTAFAITHTLGGTLYLLNEGPDAYSKPFPSVDHRDADTVSIPVRMASYTVGLLTDVISYHDLDRDSCDETFKLLSVTLSLMNDDLSVARTHALWSTDAIELERQMASLYEAGKNLIDNWLRDPSWKDDGGALNASLVRSTFDTWTPGFSKGLTSTYYHAKARSEAISELIDMHGWSTKHNTELEAVLRPLTRSSDTIRLCDFIVEYRVPLAKSSVAQRYCNELVADLTAVDMTKDSDKHLRMLIVLNLIFQHLEEIEATIAKQRVVFLVQKVITWLQTEMVSEEVVAESCKLLTVLLPRICDLYGAHWADVLNFILNYWIRNTTMGEDALRGHLPTIHATLRLYLRLKRMTEMSEPNEDLAEAWADKKDEAANGLLHVLKLPQTIPESEHQPLRAVNELLSRLILTGPPKPLQDMSELFHLLDSNSQSIQETTYTILHQQIPEQQQQASVDAILSDKAARLPDELLSFIIAVPNSTDREETLFDERIPSHLRGYLLSWLLVFDYFQHAPHKVRNDYAEQVKDGDYLGVLLNFTFRFLGHSEGKPVDVSKLDWTTYTIGAYDKPVIETRVLLTHLYYLSLLYLGSLAKSWWLDCPSRQTKVAVESWTDKYISSVVISHELDDVKSWSTSQDNSDPEEKALEVRTSRHLRSGGTLTAAYPVDDKSCTIEIALPATFPLHPATVSSISRVAVDEKHWTAWLRRAQGAILFNNNDLVAGLINFKKNISGALKGVSECAICYSIVAEDGKLPNKTCRTCKNRFHGGCLFTWFKTSNASLCPLCRQPFNY